MGFDKFYKLEDFFVKKQRGGGGGGGSLTIPGKIQISYHFG